MEIWKEMFDGLYEVSTFGKVRRKAGGQGARVGKVLKQFWYGGYLWVRFRFQNRYVCKKVHILVARTFLGPCPEGKQVNHKDGVKGNCQKYNLEYITPSENQKHAYRLGLRKPMFGEKHPNSKLTRKEVLEIRKKYKRGLGETLAKQYGVSRVLVGLIVKGKAWKRTKI